VLVTGEAGIGKTRLVAELVATLDPAVPVLAGQGAGAILALGAIFPYDGFGVSSPSIH
jgi:hypothetical protein